VIGSLQRESGNPYQPQEGCLKLDADHTKTREPRRVYFGREVKEILERLARVRHISPKFVFTYKGSPVKSIKTALGTALEKAKIKDFRLHDLRHTFVTNARKAGVDRTVIMKLTGPRTLSMFTRYNSVDQADPRQALKLIRRTSAAGRRIRLLQYYCRSKKGVGNISEPLKSLAPRVGLEPTT